MSESAAPPEASSSGGLFTRQSSGLVRELGIPAATAIALASVAVVNTFINFSAGLTSFSHPDMVLPLLLAAGIWFVGMFAYRYLLQAIPRAGGEYVYVSRVISPVLGAMVGVGVAVAFTYILAANAQFTAAFMPFALTGLGDAFSSSWIAAGANHVTSKTAIALICVGLLVIVGLLSLLPLRRVAQVILGLVVIQLLAFVALGGILLFHSHSDFVELVRQLQPQLQRVQLRALGRQAQRRRHRHQPHGVPARRALHGAELQRRALLVLRRRRAEAAGAHVRVGVVSSASSCSSSCGSGSGCSCAGASGSTSCRPRRT